MQNGEAILEDSLAVFYQVKHTLGRGPSNSASGYLTNKVKTYGFTRRPIM